MYQEALTERGRVLFPRLSRFESFYLVGGTALALQISHRRSVDFDLFTEKELPDRLLQKVKRVFNDAMVIVTYNVPGQLNITIDGIKATFFEYPYAVTEPLVTYESVPMLSVREIAASKAFSIGKRLSYKDYVDWYFLLSGNYVQLEDVVRLANRKYGNDFNDRLFLGQMASLGDVNEQPIDFLTTPVDRKTVDTYLKDAIRSFKL